MGKTKKKSKLSRARVNPFPVASSAGASAANTSTNTNTNVNDTNGTNNSEAHNKAFPLVEQLKSTTNSANDKVIALTSIAVMCNDSTLREEFMKQNLMGTLFTQDPVNESASNSDSSNPVNVPESSELSKCFLNNRSLDVINQTLEVLKIIVFEDGYSIATHLWKKRRIWTYLEAILNNLKNSFNQFAVSMDKFSKNERDLLFELTENVFGLIIGLINGSEGIFDEILNNSADNPKMNLIVEFTLSLLRWTLDINENSDKKLKISLKLLNTILDLIYDFSSESAEFIERLVFTYGFNLQQLIDFGQIMKPLQNITKIYIESIKFQVFEVVGARLSASSGASPSPASEDRFEAQRDAVFVEIYQNLSNFLTNSIDVSAILTKSQINPLDYISQNQSLESPEFSSKYQEKINANDDIQAVEISLDLIATIIEYAGTKPDFAQLIQEYQESNEYYPELLNYYGNNSLIIALIDPKFFRFLGQCLVNYDLRFELRALDCFINLAILYGNLKSADLPADWLVQVKDLWNFFTSANENESEKAGASPIFRQINSLVFFKDAANAETIIYDLHLQTKVFGFLNATIKTAYADTKKLDESVEDILEKTVASVGQHFVQIAIVHHTLIQLSGQKKNKKKKFSSFSVNANSAESKEFLETVNQYYFETFQLVATIAQLPSIKVNSVAGQFLVESVLNSNYSINNTVLQQIGPAENGDSTNGDQSDNSKNTILSLLQPQLIIDLISSIFDVYGDANFVYDEPNFVNKHYVQFLQDTKVLLKNQLFKAKIDKNKEPELKSLSFEAIKELERFIRYKETERR